MKILKGNLLNIFDIARLTKKNSYLVHPTSCIFKDINLKFIDDRYKCGFENIQSCNKIPGRITMNNNIVLLYNRYCPGRYEYGLNPIETKMQREIWLKESLYVLGMNIQSDSDLYFNNLNFYNFKKNIEEFENNFRSYNIYLCNSSMFKN